MRPTRLPMLTTLLLLTSRKPLCRSTSVATILAQCLLALPLLLTAGCPSSAGRVPDTVPIRAESANRSQTLDGSVSGVAPLKVTFTAPAFDDYEYVWDFGDDSDGGLGRIAVHTYQRAGTFEARCQLIDETGATVSLSEGVIVLVVDGSPQAFDTFEGARARVTDSYVAALNALLERRSEFDDTAIAVPAVQILGGSVPPRDTSPQGWVTRQVRQRRNELVVAPSIELLDALKSATVNDAHVGIVERAEIDQIVSELLLAFDDDFNEDTASRIGSLAAANAFVFLQIQPTFVIVGPKSPLTINTRWVVKGEYRAKARLVDSQTGTAIWFQTVTWERQFEVVRN